MGDNYHANVSRKGLTLLELLVVIAINAILASIAVINFQLAQAKSKVARVRADMAVLAGALQCYRLDQREYPSAASGDEIVEHPLNHLTTPVAYLVALPKDPFGSARFAFNPGLVMAGYNYKDRATTSVGMPGETYGHIWEHLPQYDFFVHSCGPNRLWDVLPYVEYDPSNGTVSAGDITRFGP